MKHLKTLSAAALLIAGCGGSADAPQLGKNSIDEVIAAMTNEEKAYLLVGSGMKGATGTEPVVGTSDDLVPGAAGTTHAIPRLGIPAIVLFVKAVKCTAAGRKVPLKIKIPLFVITLPFVIFGTLCYFGEFMTAPLYQLSNLGK